MMSALGHKQALRRVGRVSALRAGPDINRRTYHDHAAQVVVSRLKKNGGFGARGGLRQFN